MIGEQCREQQEQQVVRGSERSESDQDDHSGEDHPSLLPADASLGRVRLCSFSQNSRTGSSSPSSHGETGGRPATVLVGVPKSSGGWSRNQRFRSVGHGTFRAGHAAGRLRRGSRLSPGSGRSSSMECRTSFSPELIGWLSWLTGHQFEVEVVIPERRAKLCRPLVPMVFRR